MAVVSASSMEKQTLPINGERVLSHWSSSDRRAGFRKGKLENLFENVSKKHTADYLSMHEGDDINPI